MEQKRRIGVVEIGSRAVRFLAAAVDNHGGMNVLRTKYEHVSLSKAIEAPHGQLEKTVSKVDRVVEEFVALGRSLELDSIFCFGTASLRLLSQSNPQIVNEYFGSVTVLDERAEAECSLWAAVNSSENQIRELSGVAVLDLGSGSFEIATGSAKFSEIQVCDFKTLNLGSRALIKRYRDQNDKFGHFYDVLSEEVSELQIDSDGEIENCFVMGSAATNAAWLEVREYLTQNYSPTAVHGRRMTTSRLNSLVTGLLQEFQKDASGVRNWIDPRAPDGDEFEVIVTGLALFSLILPKLGVNSYKVCCQGTRHGVLWRIAQDKDFQVENLAAI